MLSLFPDSLLSLHIRTPLISVLERTLRTLSLISPSASPSPIRLRPSAPSAAHPEHRPTPHPPARAAILLSPKAATINLPPQHFPAPAPLLAQPPSKRRPPLGRATPAAPPARSSRRQLYPDQLPSPAAFPSRELPPPAPVPFTVAAKVPAGHLRPSLATFVPSTTFCLPSSKGSPPPCGPCPHHRHPSISVR